jgi:hypothetical protein
MLLGGNTIKLVSHGWGFSHREVSCVDVYGGSCSFLAELRHALNASVYPVLGEDARSWGDAELQAAE